MRSVEFGCDSKKEKKLKKKIKKFSQTPYFSTDTAVRISLGRGEKKKKNKKRRKTKTITTNLKKKKKKKTAHQKIFLNDLLFGAIAHVMKLK